MDLRVNPTVETDWISSPVSREEKCKKAKIAALDALCRLDHRVIQEIHNSLFVNKSWFIQSITASQLLEKCKIVSLNGLINFFSTPGSYKVEIKAFRELFNPKYNYVQVSKPADYNELKDKIIHVLGRAILNKETGIIKLLFEISRQFFVIQTKFYFLSLVNWVLFSKNRRVNERELKKLVSPYGDIPQPNENVERRHILFSLVARVMDYSCPTGKFEPTYADNYKSCVGYEGNPANRDNYIRDLCEKIEEFRLGTSQPLPAKKALKDFILIPFEHALTYLTNPLIYSKAYAPIRRLFYLSTDQHMRKKVKVLCPASFPAVLTSEKKENALILAIKYGDLELAKTLVKLEARISLLKLKEICNYLILEEKYDALEFITRHSRNLNFFNTRLLQAAKNDKDIPAIALYSKINKQISIPFSTKKIKSDF